MDEARKEELVNGFQSVTDDAMAFVKEFEMRFGRGERVMTSFVQEGFVAAWERARREEKLLFVYLHSEPDDTDTKDFCEWVLCDSRIVNCFDTKFVCWGGSWSSREGILLREILKPARFPFWVMFLAPNDQDKALILTVDGIERTGHPEENFFYLVQDAIYRRLELEGRKELDAPEREVALTQRREEKARFLGPEPEQGPDVIEVTVCFANGERKVRRFLSTSTMQSLYDYVDSADCLHIEYYKLVTRCPRIVYGPAIVTLSLKDARLEHGTTLYVEQLFHDMTDGIVEVAFDVRGFGK